MDTENQGNQRTASGRVQPGGRVHPRRRPRRSARRDRMTGWNCRAAAT